MAINSSRLHAHMVKRFLAELGGARRDALARAPHGADQAATIGAVLIITAVIAAFTGGYAIHQVFLGSPLATWIAAAGAILWAGWVFSVDRGLIMAIDRGGPPSRVALQVLARLPLALIVALVMSTVFLLKICEGPIRLQLRAERQELWLKEISSVSQASGLSQIRQTISELRSIRDEHRERLLREPDSFQYRASLGELQKAERTLRSLNAALAPRIDHARKELDRLLAGPQPNQAEALRRQITDWQAQLSRARHDVQRARVAVEKAAEDWRAVMTAALNSAAQEISKLETLEVRASEEVAKHGAAAERDLSDITRPNLLNSYRTLRRITSNPSHPDAAAIRTFELALHVLFLIIELTPVLTRAFGRPTPLDVAMEAVEFLDSERVNLEANREASRLKKAAETVAAVEEQALEKWRDHQIQVLNQTALSSLDIEKVLENVGEVARNHKQRKGES